MYFIFLISFISCNYNYAVLHWLFFFYLCEVSLTLHSSLRTSCWSSYLLNLKKCVEFSKYLILIWLLILCAPVNYDFIYWSSLLFPLWIPSAFTLPYFFFLFHFTVDFTLVDKLSEITCFSIPVTCLQSKKRYHRQFKCHQPFSSAGLHNT